MSKQCGTQTVDVLLEFPSFVASIKLLGRVSGALPKEDGINGTTLTTVPP